MDKSLETDFSAKSSFHCTTLLVARPYDFYQDAPLLSAIIDNTYDDEEGESSSSVIGQELGDVITLVIGGYHTTGYGLTWVLHYMSLHQGVQDKVRTEIIKVLGHDR